MNAVLYYFSSFVFAVWESHYSGCCWSNVKNWRTVAARRHSHCHCPFTHGRWGHQLHRDSVRSVQFRSAAPTLSAIMFELFSIAAIRHRLTPFPQLREKMRELRDANARHGLFEGLKQEVFDPNALCLSRAICCRHGESEAHLQHQSNNQWDESSARSGKTASSPQKVSSPGTKPLSKRLGECCLYVENSPIRFLFSIMDLELARDELLFEVHKSDSPNKDYEKNVCVRPSQSRLL